MRSWRRGGGGKGRAGKNAADGAEHTTKVSPLETKRIDREHQIRCLQPVDNTKYADLQGRGGVRTPPRPCGVRPLAAFAARKWVRVSIPPCVKLMHSFALEDDKTRNHARWNRMLFQAGDSPTRLRREPPQRGGRLARRARPTLRRPAARPRLPRWGSWRAERD